MDPAALEERMTRYILGELSPMEATAFESLLAENPELAEEARSLRQSFHLMPYAATAEPPPALRAKVLAAARAAARRRRTRGLLSRSSRAALATAAALLIAVLIWDGYRLRRELKLQRELIEVLQQPNVLLSFSMRGTAVTSSAFGSVVLDLDGKKAAVVLRGVPPLPGDQVYRLWALVGKVHVPCGQFNAKAEEGVVRQIPIPVDAYTAPIAHLLLTREPAAGAGRPMGAPVMVSTTQTKS